MSKVIFYDIPTRAPKRPWSLNPWKTRMVLNYKGIGYKTEWVEYPDLVTTLKKVGLPPNDPTEPGYFTDYTSPAIKYEDSAVSMDSWKIAHELEKRYPTPSLHLDDPIVTKIQDSIKPLRDPLAPYLMPKVPKVILGEESADYFELTRAEIYGMPLSQLAGQANEECWEKAAKPAREVAELLEKNGGPYFLGETVSYADFILVSFLHFLKMVDAHVYERFVKFDPAYENLYEASKQWLEKEN